MKYLLNFLHILEVAILFPSFLVCLCVFYFSKDQLKADKFVDWWVKKLSWVVSIIVWITLYLIF